MVPFSSYSSSLPFYIHIPQGSLLNVFLQPPHTILHPHTWFQGPSMHQWLLIHISSSYTSRSAPFILLPPWYLQPSVVQAPPILYIWHKIHHISCFSVCLMLIQCHIIPPMLKPQTWKSFFHIPVSIFTSN